MRKTGIYLSSLLLGKQMARSCVLDRLRFCFFFCFDRSEFFFHSRGIEAAWLEYREEG